ncbi:glucoamylase [Rubidibacter lacunae KORDI 51-2]|uniref:Glucoamylase n=1 Tax=Rubidibacter lacunae KORDI 51-2 TaxID=582515 RepID=U5DPQ2_9CHRO|nr:glycoside hydrolase family 15 protein [Rubidibacter lacunae]ERN42574.1 glucoamylase [Rubidibacter lacunae KORDI 51-2]
MPTTRDRLNAYAAQIQDIILCRQHPVTGLLPASTSVNAHGDYTDAWVRDNAYSILAVWGLALAYRRHDPDSSTGFELEHSVIKLMRGLLYSMMRQSDKVEAFKHIQTPRNALHAKYGTTTGRTVVGDDEWGHLQLDATSLYLLVLAQMTASGVQIIYTLDEVNFIQNLVYYIGRAYRTPDYGIWERGHKINHGAPELNASSVGMAKAALEALQGLDLFGTRGSPASAIHVLPDEIARSRLTLESLLPRESSSKETDAALLSVIGFPAFAIEDRALVERTRAKIVASLQGNYGCKRFLRDGHQTSIEDTSRLHYEPYELQQFEHIECEWPLFFAYLMLDALFSGDLDRVREYRDRLQRVSVKRDGWELLPEVYYVPSDRIDAERARPYSQQRLPNENLPLVWAQSLYLLGQMLADGTISPGDIDPLGRHLKVGRDRAAVVQIALLAEDEALQSQLADHNIATETPQQVEPIQIRRATDLVTTYGQVGRNDALGLSGLPHRRLRSLTTSRAFRICGDTIVFLPAFLDEQQFYLTFDYHFTIDLLKSELAYLQRQWSDLGRPMMTLLLTHRMLASSDEEPGDRGMLEPFLELLQELKAGECNGVCVKLGRLQQLLLTASSERIDSLNNIRLADAAVKNARPRPQHLPHCPERCGPLSHTQEFALECETNLSLLLSTLQSSPNLYEQVELLQALVRLQGVKFDTGFGGPERRVTVAMLLEEVYAKAGSSEVTGTIHWSVVRRCAGLLGKIDIGLSDAVTDILVHGKQIAVGRSYDEGSAIHQPMSRQEIYDRICQYCREDIGDRVLTQEILIYLSAIVRSEPKLLDGLLMLRVGFLILLLASELGQEHVIPQDDAYNLLMKLPPSQIQRRLRRVLESYDSTYAMLQKQESLHARTPLGSIDVIVRSVEPDAEAENTTEGWLRWRQLTGALNRVPKDFYPSVWQLLKGCPGIVIGDKFERRNRLESKRLLSEMTPGEKNFALRVEHLLNKIDSPEYRQVTIEALVELSALFERNPELHIEEYLVLDVLVGHAVRLAWLDEHPGREADYDSEKALAWRAFYDKSPRDCARYIADALRYLAQLAER